MAWQKISGAENNSLKTFVSRWYSSFCREIAVILSSAWRTARVAADLPGAGAARAGHRAALAKFTLVLQTMLRKSYL
jgi:hypothetical protein